MSDPYGIKPFIRTVNDFPIDGVKFRDITSLLESPSAYFKTCRALTGITKEFSADLIVSIESRGFIFGGAISYNLYLPLILARKSGKLPNETFKKDFTLEYGNTTLEIQKNTNINKTDKIVIIDDIVATGGTAKACANLLNKNFKVPKKKILILAIINLTDLNGSKLLKKSGLEVKTIVSY